MVSTSLLLFYLSCSWAWQKNLKLKPLVRKKVRFRVGNSISLRFDCWHLRWPSSLQVWRKDYNGFRRSWLDGRSWVDHVFLRFGSAEVFSANDFAALIPI
ncbi:hypothetical protein SLA2020_429740 [Shorea laevis]